MNIKPVFLAVIIPPVHTDHLFIMGMGDKIQFLFCTKMRHQLSELDKIKRISSKVSLFFLCEPNIQQSNQDVSHIIHSANRIVPHFLISHQDCHNKHDQIINKGSLITNM